MNIPQHIQEIHDLVSKKVPGLTIAGACELSAYPLDQIRIVLAAFSTPHHSKSAYSFFRRKLNDYCNAADIKGAWREAYEHMESLGFTKESKKEETSNDEASLRRAQSRLVGRTSNQSSSDKSTFNKHVFLDPHATVHKLNPDKYTKPDYETLFNEFEKRRGDGFESQNVPNPFAFRMSQQQKASTVGLDYAADQKQLHHNIKAENPETLSDEALKFELARSQGLLGKGFEDMPNPFIDKAAALRYFADALGAQKKGRGREERGQYKVNTQEEPFVAKKENLDAFEKVRKDLEEKEAEKAATRLERLVTVNNFLNEYQNKQASRAYHQALALTVEPLVDLSETPPIIETWDDGQPINEV